MSERYLRFECELKELVGTLTEGSPGCRRGVLVVHPMGEEKKFAHRVLAQTAWALGKAGVWTLRFDLSGSGDSFGEFREATLGGWKREIIVAAAVLKRESRVEEIAVLGLRLGASLAWLVRGEIAGLREAVLWEPALSGKHYLESLWQRKLVREMMTTGKGKTTWAAGREEMTRTGYVDLDGWDLGAALAQDLEKLDLTRSEPPCPSRTLAVQIAFNGKVSPELEKFAGTVRAANGVMETMGIRERPIWDRVELVEAAELTRTTVAWLTEKR